MDYLIEKRNFYNIGDIVLIEYFYNDMITPVKIIDMVGRNYMVSHGIPESFIFNAADEVIKASDIIDIYKLV